MVTYSGFQLGARSRKRLNGVHPALVQVVEMAIQRSEVDFTVLEGVRSVERQWMLFERGKSQTMNSRHLTGHAVDLGAWVGNAVVWDWSQYHKIAEAMKGAAADLDVAIEWGGDWETFKDGPHFQLSHEAYPAEEGDTVVASPAPPTVKPSPQPAVAPVPTPAHPEPTSRFGRLARIITGVAAATGIGASVPALETLQPVVESWASGVGLKEALIAGLGGVVADLLGKNRKP